MSKEHKQADLPAHGLTVCAAPGTGRRASLFGWSFTFSCGSGMPIFIMVAFGACTGVGNRSGARR